jgi:hypothetical protein
MICSACGNHNPVGARTCLRCGRPDARYVQAYSLSGLANVLTALFSIAAALFLLSVATSIASTPTSVSGGFSVQSGLLGLVALLLMLVTVVLFLNWFYRARKNAGLSTWPQRLSPGWAVGSWFLPPVLLWFPYQIMADIWQAGRPRERRPGVSDAALPGLWWTFWILAWVTSFEHIHQTTSGITSDNYTLNFGGTRLSAAFAAAAAITLIVIIRKVSASPVGRPVMPSATGQPTPMNNNLGQ